MTIPSFEYFYNITWYTDSKGRKIQYLRYSIPFQVVNGKVELGEIPDSLYKIRINGMTEIHLNGLIKTATTFKCNYNTGTLYFDNSQEGKFFNITFSAKGKVKYYSKNMILEDKNNVFASDNVEDALYEAYQRINNLIISNSQPLEVQDARANGATGVNFPTLKNRLDDDSAKNKANTDKIGSLTGLNNDNIGDELRLINTNLDNNQVTIDTLTSQKLDAYNFNDTLSNIYTFDSYQDVIRFSDLTFTPNVSHYYSLVSRVQAKVSNDGTIKMRGVAKVNPLPTSGAEYTIGVLPFDYTSNFDSAQRMSCVVCNDSNNNSKIFPCTLRDGGSITITGLTSSDYVYLNYINFSGVTFSTWIYDCEQVYTMVTTIKNKLRTRKINNMFIFPYLTDTHYNLYDRRRNFNLNLLKNIDTEINCDCFLSGGDNVLEPITYASNVGKWDMYLTHKNFFSQIPNNKFIFVKGNHDDNNLQGQPNNGNYVLRPSEMKSIYHNPNFINGSNNAHYGYIDFSSKKIRIVVLDTFETDYTQTDVNCPSIVSETQLNWIGNTALNFTDKGNDKTNWHVIFVGHKPPLEVADGVIGLDNLELLTNRLQLYNIMLAFKNGTSYSSGSVNVNYFVQGAMSIIAYFYGHFHATQNQSKGGINFISSICGYVADTFEAVRRIGQISEPAIDIVSIDKSNKKIYLDRLGAGSDRIISY